jgi:hypothetical protein
MSVHRETGSDGRTVRATRLEPEVRGEGRFLQRGGRDYSRTEPHILAAPIVLLPREPHYANEIEAEVQASWRLQHYAASMIANRQASLRPILTAMGPSLRAA